MNEKTATQIAEMKKQTIGVEVEMNNITRAKAAKLVASYFETNRYEDTAYRNGYSTWSAWDAQGREWKFQKDISIHGFDEEKCEMVTPILTYDDIPQLQEVIRIPQGRCQERCYQRVRCSYSHRSERAYTQDPPQPRQHHGEPRIPFGGSP